MKQILTNDNSITFYSELYDECYHSKSGAIEEAIEKYIKPCKLKNDMVILDFCFGLGYNTLMAIHTVNNLKIIGLEKDKKLLNSLSNIKVSPNLQKDYEKVVKAAKNLYYIDDKVEIKILLGDARRTLKQIDAKFDAVFFDPFSPKKCSELWTEKIFKQIKSKMNNGAILTTYSCAKQVRVNLQKAGFKVYNGPCVGRKSPSTVAIV